MLAVIFSFALMLLEYQAQNDDNKFQHEYKVTCYGYTFSRFIPDFWIFVRQLRSIKVEILLRLLIKVVFLQNEEIVL